jgi:hypothetical protein
MDTQTQTPARRVRKAKPQPQFPTFQPGQGWLLFSKRVDADTALWQGPLVLGDETLAQMRAKAVRNGDKPRYEVDVHRIGEPGKPWPVIASFILPAFGDKLVQEVNIKGIGKAKTWKVVTRTQRSGIRFQLLDVPVADEPVM